MPLHEHPFAGRAIPKFPDLPQLALPVAPCRFSHRVVDDRVGVHGNLARLATAWAPGCGVRALESALERAPEPNGRDRRARLVAFLERDVWPFVPPGALGHASDSCERERILGYGEEGV